MLLRRLAVERLLPPLYLLLRGIGIHLLLLRRSGVISGLRIGILPWRARREVPSGRLGLRWWWEVPAGRLRLRRREGIRVGVLSCGLKLGLLLLLACRSRRRGGYGQRTGLRLLLLLLLRLRLRLRLRLWLLSSLVYISHDA